MSRLTRYHQESLLTDEGGYYEPNASNYYDIVVKLGKLEDLEDELGCPLDVVFKALKEGVNIKIDDEEIDIEGWKLSIWLKEQCFIINEMLFKTKLPFSDYKKTWFLKGDLSE